VIIFLHGNHLTCGMIPPAGNPITEGTVPAPGILVGPGNQFTGNGTCPAAFPNEIPSDEGYDYLAFQLARLGFIVDSIDNNRGITGLFGGRKAPGVAGDDALIRARGVMVLKTLQNFFNTNWNENDSPDCVGFLNEPSSTLPALHRPSSRRCQCPVFWRSFGATWA
jgi:hypothetical protein